ncbi:MAG: hypothetical protein K6A71_02905 [Lachnospiraceae bacterium]|nr:hypothetical protein [Lachnospiraceae bacterium]
MTKPTDQEIWEWLHGKEESQTISLNSFLIEELRRMMLADKGMVAVMPSPILPEHTTGKASSEKDTESEEDMKLSEDALDFLSQF